MEGELDFGLPRECLRHMSKKTGLEGLSKKTVLGRKKKKKKKRRRYYLI